MCRCKVVILFQWNAKQTETRPYKQSTINNNIIYWRYRHHMNCIYIEEATLTTARVVESVPNFTRNYQLIKIRRNVALKNRL